MLSMACAIGKESLTLRAPLIQGTANLSLIKDAARPASRAVGASAVPARGLAIRARAALGIMFSGTTAGVRGAASGLGQEGAGNARLANFTVHVPGSLAWS